MSNIELRKEWEERVTVFKSSGQSTKEWCAANDFKINRLHYWFRKIKKEDKSTRQKPQWMSVEIGS